MAEIIRMPKMSDTMEEGVIASWLKKVGDEIKMDDLSNVQSASKNKSNKSKSFTIVIADFYYQETADNLKNELIKKNQFNNMYVKKINNNKYRLLVGPFENFNALKTTYISLNNLGFENLNVYKE